MINLINTGCDHPLSPSNGNVEAVPPVFDISAKISLEKHPQEVYLALGM
jgi:hypothetical protein